MGIYLKKLQELFQLDDTIVKTYNEIKELETLPHTYEESSYHRKLYIKQKQNAIAQMSARKATIEEHLKSLDINILYGLYEFVATYNNEKDKLRMICYLFELIEKKESIMRG